MIKGVLIDLGDTLIEQQVDDEEPLSAMELVAFPDAQPVLSQLKTSRYKIAIVSNTSQSNKEHIAEALKKLDLLQYVDTIITSVDVGEKKPHAKMFTTAIENLGLSINEVAMVGNDIIEDIGGAQKLGITTVFLNQDETPVQLQEPPIFTISSLQDLPVLLKSYCGKTTVKPSFSEEEDYEYLSQTAQNAENNFLWSDAARYHIKAANYCLVQNEYEKASSHFMKAARCREQDEDWRETGHLWLQTSETLQHTNPSEVKRSYEDYDGAKHFFMGIETASWDKLTKEEKIGRAYRYTGYHLEQAGANQSAYLQYFKAGLAFDEANDWVQAGRAFYLAIISFIHQFGELNHEYLQHLESSNQQCIAQDKKKFLQRAHLYYQRIAAELYRQGNGGDREIMLIKHKEITRTLARDNGKIGQWLLYTFWKRTSMYGTNFYRWLTLSIFIVIVLFPLLYSTFNLLSPPPVSLADSVHFSIGNFVTLTYIEFTPVGWGVFVAILELITGVFMIGSLVTLVINKIVP